MANRNTKKRARPGIVFLAIVLVLILLTECVFLGWFIQTRILSQSFSETTSETVPTTEADSLENTDSLSVLNEDSEAEKSASPQTESPVAESPAAQQEETQPTEEIEEDTSNIPAEPENDDPLTQRAEALLQEMTLEEKICQMFLITPEGLTGVDCAVRAGETTKQALEAYPVGGLVYFSANIESESQIIEMVTNSQSYVKTKLFIAVDEEGGVVSRLANTLGNGKLDAMYTYHDLGETTAYDNAVTLGSNLLHYRFNLDFAPVADTWTNPDNTVIGTRAYSDNYEQAASLIASAVAGFHDAGVLCTLKHFPGHGDTAEDSHTDMAYLDKSADELLAEDWLPFQAGIAAGADMVMVGHIVVPQLDEYPASLSSVLVTDMLRGELGFQGVVITDSLVMEGLTDLYTQEEIILKAVEAGCDILLMPADFRSAYETLLSAVQTGTFTEDRINESVIRILKAKLNCAILS